jgi:hypothetical protein
MKNDRFINGVYQVSPNEGSDGFDDSRFPEVKVVEKKKTLMAVNRLFRSQTAFMPMVEDFVSGEMEKPEVSVKTFLPTPMVA